MKKYFLFLFFLCNIVFFWAQTTSSFVVVIDAGHGGTDVGAIGIGAIKEKDITLAVAKKVGEKIKTALGKNIKVYYTRLTDNFIPLDERASIATRNHADLFVSIHCNANPSEEPNGAESYVLGLHKTQENLEIAKKENSVILLEKNYKQTYHNFDPNSVESLIGLTLMQDAFLTQSIYFADKVQQNLGKINRANRGVKQAGFLVLKNAATPSTLIEIGFITHKTESKYLNSNEGQNKIATAITNAILNYRQTYYTASTIRETVTETETAEKTTDTTEKPLFKVQLATSTTKMEPTPANFKGLKNVKRLSLGKNYIYVYYESTAYESCKTKLKYAQQQGYPNAFIYAIYKGKRISVAEALKKIAQ